MIDATQAGYQKKFIILWASQIFPYFFLKSEERPLLSPLRRNTDEFILNREIRFPHATHRIAAFFSNLRNGIGYSDPHREAAHPRIDRFSARFLPDNGAVRLSPPRCASPGSNLFHVYR